MFENPWEAGFDVIEIINDVWKVFTPIELPEEVLLMWRELKGNKNKIEKIEAEHEIIIFDTNKIYDEIRNIPIKKETTKQDPKIQELRKTYPRAYESWSSNEDAWLLQSYQESLEMKNLSDIFQRHPGSIQSRLSKLLKSRCVSSNI